MMISDLIAGKAFWITSLSVSLTSLETNLVYACILKLINFLIIKPLLKLKQINYFFYEL